MSEPTTEAAKALLHYVGQTAMRNSPFALRLAEAALAIEAEAAAQERERIAREIEGLPVNDDITWADDQPVEAFVNLAAVLAIVRGEDA